MRATDSDQASRDNERFVTAGVDIGMRAVKVVLLAHRRSSESPHVLASEIVTVARRRNVRDPQSAVREGWFRSLRSAGLAPADVALVACTGQRNTVAHVGHFYRRSSVSAGVRYLFPAAVAVLDVGARQMRCTRLPTLDAGRGYAAIGKGEGWGGEVMDAVARTNGGSSLGVTRPTASLAAYEEVAARASRLMHLLSLEGPIAITGAMAVDSRFLSLLARRLVDDRLEVALLTSPEAVFIGAYGAALLAARRYLRAARSRRSRDLAARAYRPMASPPRSGGGDLVH